MDEMRSEIRSAFEKEQAGHAPAAAMRHNIVDAVTAQPRSAANLQWLAVAAAVLLGILVVVGLMSTRFNHRASVPATPHASPVADLGPPPAGVPLLYVHDPNHASWLIGYDWSAKPRGTVKLDPAIAGVGMAPDGQSFAVGFGAKGGTGEILDRLGRPIQGVGGAIPGNALPMWADDNQHMCGVTLDQQSFVWTLITLFPGEAVKPVLVIARDTGVGQSGIRLASCSFRNDQAIVVRTTIAWPSELWVIRLSTGKVLSHHTYSTSGDLANVVGSADAVLLAENSSKSNGQLQQPLAPSTIIRRVSDRSVVATLDPSMGVLGFNSDDSLVLVTTTPWVGGQPTAMAVIDLASNQTLWRYNGPGMFGGSVAQPGGRDFAIYVRQPTVQDPLTDVTIVHADGTATDFPQRYQPSW